MELIEHYGHILRKEADLFVGAILFIMGLLNWSSGKYCDGNTADYLACTNPTTYYYYSAAALALVVVGVCFMLLWNFRRKAR